MKSKRMISAVMALIVSATFTGSNLAEPIELSSKAFSAAVAVSTENTVTNPTDVWYDSYDTWKEVALYGSGYSAVGFLDLDFDGTLELVTGNNAGSGNFTGIECFKVQNGVVTKLVTSPEWLEVQDNLLGEGLKLYRNNANNTMGYYGDDYLRGGYAYNETTFCSFSLDSESNIVSRTNYFSEVNELLEENNEWQTKYYTHFTDVTEVTKDEYNAKKNAFMATLTDLNLNYKFVDIRKFSDEEIKQALLESYNTFSYDGMSNSHPVAEELDEEELKARLATYGTVSVWEYHDYDGNGTNEAFAAITKTEGIDHLDVYFVSSSGNVTRMSDDFSGDYYENTGKYSIVEDKGFFSLDIGGHGSGWQTLLYSVKSNEPYELDVSRELQGFYQNTATGKFYTTKSDFSNGYHEYPEYDLIYDRYSQQFTIGERSKNEQAYGDYVYYVNDDDEVVITQYKGTEENITIPSEIDGKKVTTISGIEGPADLEYRRIGAFQNNENLKSVTIPDTVTTIEMYSFMACYNLANVTMSNNIKTIEQYAFEGCNLSYIYLPETIERIEEQAIGYSSSGVIDKFVIYGFSGTVAETYANDNGILFVERNSDDTIIQPLEINLDYEKISDYTTLPNDDTVRLMGYPVYKITATVKNIDLKTASNVTVKLNPSSEVTLIDGDESQTVETINSNETVTFSWTAKMDATKTYSTRCEVTAKADNSVESKSYLTIALDSDVIGRDNRFDFTKDTWKFTNSSNYFSKGHYMTDDYMNSYFPTLPNITAQKYKKWKEEKWAGSCYGLSTIAILTKMGLLDVTAFPASNGSNAEYLHEVATPDEDKTGEVYSLITAYHLSQFTPTVEEINKESASYNTNRQLHQLVDDLLEVQNGGMPVNLCCTWFTKDIFSGEVSEYVEQDGHIDNENEAEGITGHSIVAYDVEFLEDDPIKIKDTVTGKNVSYSIKVHIYDCAVSVDVPTYMYITSDYEHWTFGNIAGFNDNSKIKERCYNIQDVRENETKSFSDREVNPYYRGEGQLMILDDMSVLDYRNWSDFKSNREAVLCANNKTKLLIKRNNSTYKFVLDKLIDGVYDANEMITTFFSNAAEDADGIAKANINYVLPSLTGEYTVSDPDGKATDVEYTLTYANSMVSVDASAAKEVTFNVDSVEVQADNSDYEVSLTFNEGYYSMPWYTVTASGDSANTVSMEQTEDGIILNSDNMENVSVSANNLNDEVGLVFTAEVDSVLITNHNNDLEVYSDADNNGTYETLVKTTASSQTTDNQQNTVKAEPVSNNNSSSGGSSSGSGSSSGGSNSTQSTTPTTGDHGTKPIGMLIPAMLAMWGFRRRRKDS